MPKDDFQALCLYNAESSALLKAMTAVGDKGVTSAGWLATVRASSRPANQPSIKAALSIDKPRRNASNERIRYWHHAYCAGAVFAVPARCTVPVWSPNERCQMKRIIILSVVMSIIAVAGCTPGNGRVFVEEQEGPSNALQKRLQGKTKAELLGLADDPDPTVALHAAWEYGKGDKKKTADFVERFKKMLNVAPPQWWQDRLEGVVAYETCHYFPGIDPSKLKANSRISNAEVEIGASPAEEGAGGFAYSVQAINRKTKKLLWEQVVWAAGRTSIEGFGVHQIELVLSEGRSFIFGVESHGAYAEAFRLADGVSNHPILLVLLVQLLGKLVRIPEDGH